MKQRPSREISVFNMSMLDVICSALGAILILFILAQHRESNAREEARRKDKQLEALQRSVIDAQQQAARERLQAEQARQAADTANKMLAELERMPRAMAIGMCETSAATVTAVVFDHSAADGDRVDLTWNNAPLRDNLTLPDKASAVRFDLSLEAGSNYLAAKALNVGDSSPNTATVEISPCRDGQPEEFKWDMQTGEQRHISIVRQ